MRRFKWFWSWEDDKEEKWLSEMSSRGNHLQQVDWTRFYTFEEGSPTDFTYRLEFYDERKNIENYKRRVGAAGWEYLGMSREWQYLRKEMARTSSDGLTADVSPKRDKIQRVFISRLLGLGAFLIVLLLNARFLTLEMGLAIAAVLLLIYGFVLFRLWQRMLQLQ
ncbi:MAG: DUF2812 domain-containing protein [Chloroflexota bacterium]